MFVHYVYEKEGKDTPIASCANEVEPFKKDAYFWHAVWMSAGRPLNTTLHRIMKRTRNVYYLQIRKCKNMANILKKNTLLNACVSGKGDIFTEIRKLRRSSPTVVNAIDDVTEDLPNHFAKIYNTLYNSVNDTDSLSTLYQSINERSCVAGIDDAVKVTSTIIREAVNHLKSNKNDSTFLFTSGCLKNAPAILYEQLALVFRFYIIHGHVSNTLMLSTLIPIVKYKLGNLCSSDNYRCIAISSLVLKIFDWVIILLYGDKLRLDDLQFGYEEGCSTNMCTWMAVETVDYFMRNDSDVYVCVMDMKKAFDTVQHSVLFKKLVHKGIPYIYIRLLMVYKKQCTNVKWNGVTHGLL